MTKQENGSAHVIIIASIVVILCATLGVIFYQQLMNRKESSKPSEKSSVEKTTAQPVIQAVPTQDFSLTVGGRTVSMKYPDGWKVETPDSVDAANAANASRTITSPDGKYTIIVDLLGDGTGGTSGDCSLTYASAQLTDVPNGLGEWVFEYTTKPASGSKDNGSAGAVVVSNTVKKSDLAVGSTGCSHEFQLFNDDGTSQPQDGKVSARVRLESRDEKGNMRTMTLGQQQKWASTDSYRIAIKSLLTVKG